VQRQHSLRVSEDAVSPIIGTVLILAIMISVTGTMLAWGIPQIQESEAYAIYTSAQNNFLNHGFQSLRKKLKTAVQRLALS